MARSRRACSRAFGSRAARAAPATMVQDQAIGTDQDRKFVLVLKPDSTVEYRAITVGRVVDGLRVVQTGVKPGETS